MACVGSPMKEVTEEGFDSGQAALKPELPSWVRTVLMSRCGVGRLLCVGGHGRAHGGGGTVMWAQTDVNRPDGGWIQKEDISPLLGLPHLNRPPGGGCQQMPECVPPSLLPPRQGPHQPAGPPGLRRLPRVRQPQPCPGPQVSGAGGRGLTLEGGTAGRVGASPSTWLTAQTKHQEKE